MRQKRVFYLDLLKFVSIYTMIICHLITDYYLYTAENSQGLLPGLRTLEQILYLITPSVFAFCLGGGLYLSRVKTWQKYMMRGCSLLLIGVILNIFRWIIPYWITGSEGPAEGSPVVVFNLLFGSDILFFAGLFFLLFGLLNRITGDRRIHFGILGLLSLVSLTLPPLETGNPRLDVLISNLVFVKDVSIFPLFPWSLFPIMGYFFVKAEVEAKLKNRLILLTAAGSLLLFLLAAVAVRVSGKDLGATLFWEKEGRLDLFSFPLLAAVTGFWACLFWFLAGLFREGAAVRMISAVSRNLNRIYVIHWIVIIYGEIILFFLFRLQLRGYAFLIIAPVVVFVISAVIAIQYEKLRRKGSIRFPRVKRS